MRKNELLDRFSGCLLGLGIGDALGLPVEGWSQKNILTRFGYLNGYEKGILPAGTISANTQLTILLAESLIARDTFDPQDFALRLQSWPSYQTGRGMTSLMAAARLGKGRPYAESGIKYPSSGSAARTAPLGLFYYQDEEKLKSAVSAQSRITHNDPRAVAGTYVISRLIAAILKKEEFFSEYGFKQLLEATKKISPEMAKQLSLVPKLLDAPIEEGLNVLGNSNYVLETVATAVWIFWRNLESFSETVLGAVNLGGAAGSRSALAGALSGTYLGKSQIDEKFLAGLNKNTYDALTTTAEKLWQKALIPKK